MITKLKLTNFKNFRQAEVALGPFSVLVGANASGKSNIRDALRFLHGVARGYNLAEIIGGKYGDGGQLVWSGIRGGTAEICFHGEQEFMLEVDFEGRQGIFPQPSKFQYEISVRSGSNGSASQVVADSLSVETLTGPAKYSGANGTDGQPGYLGYLIQGSMNSHRRPYERSEGVESFRFLDFSPDLMRTPSLPGQEVLGDRGENLSSVLHAICKSKDRKQALAHWIQELTPMDVADFEFMPDGSGKILVYLVEEGGSKTSANSASDGTLRFLGMLAALLGPKPAQSYFIEGIDTDIHPARLGLLVDLIAETTKRKGIQVVATTHSPQVLRLIRPEDLPHAALVYRLRGASEAHIKQLPDIPNLMDVIKKQDLARIYESSWMENVMEFTEGKPQPFELEEKGQ